MADAPVTKYTAAERQALMEKLNKETDQFIEEARARKLENGSEDDDNIDEILATHPAFMNPDEELTQEQIDANPLLKGLQMIKYDDAEDTPYDRALAHKDDGNHHFKKKIYKKARLAYTEALKQRCQNNELLAVLYTNRAAANFHLQNFRSSYLDAQAAVEIEPKRIKALTRCAQCCNALKKYDLAMEWSKVILSVEEGNQFAKDCLAENLKKKKEAERDERKKKIEKKKQDASMKVLMEAIAARNVTLDSVRLKKKDDNDCDQELSEIDLFVKRIESPTRKRVHLKDGSLFWPILFMYPQYRTSDFIEAAEENTTIDDHLQCMFADKAVWDEHWEFKAGNFASFVENFKEERLYEVPMDVPLQQILSSKKVVVRTGTPGFVILAKSSSHYKEFLGKYDQVYKLPF